MTKVETRTRRPFMYANPSLMACHPVEASPASRLGGNGRRRYAAVMDPRNVVTVVGGVIRSGSEGPGGVGGAQPPAASPTLRSATPPAPSLPLGVTP